MPQGITGILSTQQATQVGRPKGRRLAAPLYGNDIMSNLLIEIERSRDG